MTMETKENSLKARIAALENELNTLKQDLKAEEKAKPVNPFTDKVEGIDATVPAKKLGFIKAMKVADMSSLIPFAIFCWLLGCVAMVATNHSITFVDYGHLFETVARRFSRFRTAQGTLVQGFSFTFLIPFLAFLSAYFWGKTPSTVKTWTKVALCVSLVLALNGIVSSVD